MNLKRTAIVWGLLLPLMFSCDRGFDEMNINPIALTGVEPAYQFNTALVNSAFGYNNLQYEEIIVKQMINPFSGVGAAGQYNQDNRSVTSGNWQRGYRSVLKELIDVLAKTKDVPAKANLYQMTRIWTAYTFMFLTDTYGEVPYTESSLGYLKGIVTPAYDTQEFIYTQIVSELESASASLTENSPIVTTDILYAGNIVKWKRLANSILLRAGMRLSKRDPAKAKGIVEKAIAGGLFESNSDNAIIYHNASFPNPVGSELNGGQSAFFFLAEDFVTYLKKNDDPRLASIAVRYVGAKNTADQVESKANRNPAIQIGMPQGYDNTTVSEAVKKDGLASLYDYSQLDRTRMAGLVSPTIYITYAQTQLLLAEAVVRGWATGDAEVLFSSGIRAHMQQLAAYGTTSAVPDAAITAYLSKTKLKKGEELEQINTQYWIASFLNGPEAWANFRRSGFPVLVPNPFPGSDLKTESFIRRLTYTDAELNVNKENVDVAIGRQGPDLLDTRVWWDVK